MKSTYDILIIAAALILVTAGCVSKTNYNEKLQELETAKQNMAKLEEQLKERDARIASLKSENEKATRQVTTLQQEFEAAREKTRQTADGGKRKDDELKQAKRSLENVGRKLSGLRGMLADREGEIKGLEETINDLATDLGIFRSLTTKNKKKLVIYESLLKGVRSENSQIQEELSGKMESLTQLQGLLSGKDQSLSETQQQLDQKTQALSNLQGRMDEISSSLSSNQSSLNDLKTKLSQKDGLINKKDSEIASKNSALRKKDDQIAELMKQLDTLTKGSPPALKGLKGFMK